MNGAKDIMDGMDDQDVKDALEAMDRRSARQQEEWQYPRYKPADPAMVARIYRQMGRPYDASLIPEEEKHYLNGWDNGDDDDPPQAQPARNLFQPSRGGGRRTDQPWKLNWGEKGNMFGAGVQPMSAKTSGTNWWVDPKGMYPQYGGGAESLPPGEQANSAPAAPKSPQALWDDHIWNSLDVISAQTPKEKREAVNRILNERRGDFDAAYNAAYGDKTADRWENDRKFTLNAMGDYVTGDHLKAFGWQNVTDDMVKDLNDTLKSYDITTPSRIRHFLAQSAQETNEGLWPTEQEFGDNTYLDRQPYGRRYSGGGNMHTTWEENYDKLRKHTGDDRVMEGADYVAKNYPWLSAGLFWIDKDLNGVVDRLEGKDHDADVAKVTKIVNGGDNGLDNRRKYLRELLGIIPD